MKPLRSKAWRAAIGLASLMTVAMAAAIQNSGGRTYSPQGPARGPARPAELKPGDPLREPKFVAAAAASFLKGTDLVLGVSGNGEAKAYLTTAVLFHHIIDDKLGKLPIMATW